MVKNKIAHILGTPIIITTPNVLSEIEPTTILIKPVLLEKSANVISFLKSYDIIVIDDLKINFLVLGCILGLFYSLVLLVCTDFLEVLILTVLILLEVLIFCFQKISSYFLYKLYKCKKRIRNKSYYFCSFLVNIFIENMNRNEELDSFV
jgi:hypothetical protein